MLSCDLVLRSCSWVQRAAQSSSSEEDDSDEEESDKDSSSEEEAPPAKKAKVTAAKSKAPAKPQPTKVRACPLTVIVICSSY